MERSLFYAGTTKAASLPAARGLRYAKKRFKLVRDRRLVITDVIFGQNVGEALAQRFRFMQSV
jgi:hypothetical protein